LKFISSKGSRVVVVVVVVVLVVVVTVVVVVVMVVVVAVVVVFLAVLLAEEFVPFAGDAACNRAPRPSRAASTLKLTGSVTVSRLPLRRRSLPAAHS
jgi:fatty acid desaturase